MKRLVVEDLLLIEARRVIDHEDDLIVKCSDGFMKTSRIIMGILLKSEVKKELLCNEDSFLILEGLAMTDLKSLLQSALFAQGLISNETLMKYHFIDWELFKCTLPRLLNDSYKSATSENVRPSFECSICGKILSDKNNLKKHADVVHFNIRKYNCEQCGKRFISRNDLGDHIRTVHDKSKVFICDSCGQALSTRHGLRMHKLVHMEGSKSISCSRCDKTFRHLSTYRKHISRVHDFNPEKRLTCDICGKLYNHKEGLRRHVKKFHALEKPNFECAQCGQAFVFNYDLNKHVRRAHCKQS